MPIGKPKIPTSKPTPANTGGGIVPGPRPGRVAPFAERNPEVQPKPVPPGLNDQLDSQNTRRGDPFPFPGRLRGE